MRVTLTGSRVAHARPAHARCVPARAWQKVANLTDIEAAQYRRVVHPTESQGRILVQMLNGAPSSNQPQILADLRTLPTFSQRAKRTIVATGHKYIQECTLLHEASMVRLAVSPHRVNTKSHAQAEQEALLSPSSTMGKEACVTYTYKASVAQWCSVFSYAHLEHCMLLSICAAPAAPSISAAAHCSPAARVALHSLTAPLFVLAEQ